ncbi:Variant-specific surface protein, partial [Giardia duodenalis]
VIGGLYRPLRFLERHAAGALALRKQIQRPSVQRGIMCQFTSPLGRVRGTSGLGVLLADCTRPRTMFIKILWIGCALQLARAACEEQTEAQQTTKCRTGKCNVLIGGTEAANKYCSQCSKDTDNLVDGACVASAGQSGCATPESSSDSTLAGTCKSCAANYFLFKGGCYKIATAPGNSICSAAGAAGICQTCKDGYFTVSDATATQDSCVACGDDNCATCTAGTTPQKCSKCKTTGTKTYLKGSAGAGTCVTADECTANNDHYIDNTDSGPNGKTCKACSAKVENCASCASEGACQKCASGYILDGAACTQQTCSTPDCKTCTNPKAPNEICTSCVSAHYLTPTGQCISDCAALSGYYGDTDKTCKRCEVANCETCNDQGKCQTCKDGFYGESCSKCHESCKNCSGATASDCTECPSGKALKYDTTGNKGTCGDGCTPNTGNCEKCDLMVDGTAYCSKCKEANQFPQNGVCVAAGGRAITCTIQGAGVCNTCAAGSFRMDGGCYEDTKYPGKSVCTEANSAGDSCKTTTHGYKLEGGTLTTCPSNCEVCSSSTACTTCMGGYFKTSSNTCTKCDAGCATCTGTASTCSTCASGYYLSNSKCIACDRSDGSITGVSDCLSCAAPSSNTGPVLCYLMKDSTASNSDPNLSTGAIASISVAVIAVVGGLVGFLCWWFICRGKA